MVLQIGPQHETKCMIHAFHLLDNGEATKMFVGCRQELGPVENIVHDFTVQLSARGPRDLQDAVAKLLQ